jgi:energy-coupling factor transport system permease protein
MTRLNPGIKFLSILLIGVILALTYNTRLNFSVMALALALSLTVKPFKPLRILLWLTPFTLAAASFFMTGLFFAKDSPDFAGRLGQSSVALDSISTGLQLASRVLAFGSLAMLFSLSTKPGLFFHSLGQNFKLPPKFTYGLLAAYHFLPVIKGEFELVRAAMAVRGVKAMPWSTKRLVPMLVRAFRRSENLAMAMESRGFYPKAKRGRAFPVPVRGIDYMFLVLSVGLTLTGRFLL